MNYIKSSIALTITAALTGTSAVAQDKPKAFKPVPVVAAKAAAAPKLDGVADDAV